MKRLPLTLFVVGLAFVIGAPVIGIMVSFLDVVGAFHTLNASGIGDPQRLGTHIGHGLVSVMLGLLLAVTIGAPLVIAGLVVHFATRKPTGPQLEHQAG